VLSMCASLTRENAVDSFRRMPDEVNRRIERSVILGTSLGAALLGLSLLSTLACMPFLPRASWSLALVVVLSLCAEAFADADSGNSVCPSGTALDTKRTQVVFHRLRSQAQGEGLLAALGRVPVVCYGNVREGILQTDGAVVLQKDRAVNANAARLAHLLHHLVHGLPFDEKLVRSGALACDALVSKADRAERVAHKLENHLRHAFRLPPLPFEDLSDSYRLRCEDRRKSLATPAAM
jgi:hypothetical protein